MLNLWQTFLCCNVRKTHVTPQKIRIETKVSTQVESEQEIPPRPRAPSPRLR